MVLNSSHVQVPGCGGSNASLSCTGRARVSCDSFSAEGTVAAGETCLSTCTVFYNKGGGDARSNAPNVLAIGVLGVLGHVRGMRV